MTKLIFYILLDNKIGGFLIKILSFINRLFKKNDHIDLENETKIQHIYIFKFLGIGSISRSLKLIYALKKKFPKSKIIFVTFLENKSFLKIINIIDHTIYVNRRNFFLLIYSSFKSYFRIFFAKNDIMIDLEVQSNFSKFFIALLPSKIKLGFYLKDVNYIFNKQFFFDRFIFIEKNYEKISEFFNSTIKKNINTTNLLEIDKSEKLITKKLNSINISRKEKFFIINANSSDLRPERNWGERNFSSLIDRIIKDNYKIILIGSKSEKFLNDIIISKIDKKNNQIYNFAGLTSIGELIALFKIYRTVLITNDSGPMHLANIVKSPTLSLWGPGTPKSYAENYENHKIIYKKVYCSPCLYFSIFPPCKGNNICMKEIKIEEVYNIAKKLINGIK